MGDAACFALEEETPDCVGSLFQNADAEFPMMSSSRCLSKAPSGSMPADYSDKVGSSGVSCNEGPRS
jgi:hypothetical protein